MGTPDGVLTPARCDWYVVNQEALQNWVQKIDGIPDVNQLHMLKVLYRRPRWNIRYNRLYYSNTVYKFAHFLSNESVDSISGNENGEFPDGQEDLESHSKYIPRIYDEGFVCCQKIADYRFDFEKMLMLCLIYFQVMTTLNVVHNVSRKVLHTNTTLENSNPH